MPSHRLTLTPFQALTASDQDAVRQLEISTHQLDYAGSIERAIARGNDAPHSAACDAIGLAACIAGRPVGFSVLLRRTAAPGWTPNAAAALSAMRIGQAHQGQGLATEMLHALAH